ncbi:MAG: winged helix-turn-helix transcriptional regulator [Actinobacteria bacterium]|nr:winged helix-turn-helix transcriptional regulator [Actinomycetota bacterium]
MSLGYVAAGTQLPGGPERAAAALAEHVPPLDRDATLLAVIPMPGTGTSLAIVGYVISTSAKTASTARSAGLGGLRLDRAQRRVWADGHEVALTFREFELLAFLNAHPARVFSRAELVERVWRRAAAPSGDSHAIAQDSRTVDVHISRIRRKLGPRHGRSLVTEYRAGYQFRPLGP